MIEMRYSIKQHYIEIEWQSMTERNLYYKMAGIDTTQSVIYNGRFYYTNKFDSMNLDKDDFEVFVNDKRIILIDVPKYYDYLRNNSQTHQSINVFDLSVFRLVPANAPNELKELFVYPTPYEKNDFNDIYLTLADYFKSKMDAVVFFNEKSESGNTHAVIPNPQPA